MKVTILSHNLSSNAVMRAHRLAVAARTFADVTLLGPVEPKGLWPALPRERWIRTVPEGRFPGFHRSFLELLNAAEGDVLVACKPMIASFGAALVEAERRGGVPVILDLDDLDTAFTPRELWVKNPSMTDLRRPASAIYVSLLTRAAPAASAITVSSTALLKRFGGTLIPHGCLTELFDPTRIDRDAARREFGFEGNVVLFAGMPRWHKGLKPLAKAVKKIGNTRLVVLCRAEDIADPGWKEYSLKRLPLVPYGEMPRVLAAADVVAIPQLDSVAALYQMPIKVYDCMAMGKPIVATTVSDLPMVLDNCAQLVAPGAVPELRAAICNLIDKPAMARVMGERARARCLRHFSMEKVGEHLEKVVKRAVAKLAKA